MEDKVADSIAGDLLEGADAIAEFLWGDASKLRRVYCLARVLPIFRMGNIIYARKSTLLSFIETQENGADKAGGAA